MKFAFFILFLMIAQTVSFAQEDDTTVSDSLEEPEIISGEVGIYMRFKHTFETATGDSLTLLVRSGSNTVDPVMQLFDPDGNILVFNDDHHVGDSTHGKYDAMIRIAEVPVSGTYTVEISNNFWSAGEVELIIFKGGEIPRDVLEQAAFTLTTATAGSIRSDGQCTARVETIPARLRFQPNLESRVDRLLYPGHTLEVDGYYQREGTAIWYRVGGYLWVREDAVILSGDCSQLQIL